MSDGKHKRQLSPVLKEERDSFFVAVIDLSTKYDSLPTWEKAYVVSLVYRTLNSSEIQK